MKGKIFGTLFALPFFGVGVWMFWSIGHTLIDAWRMDSWVQVEASLTRGGYETHRGDDSDTYEAYALYSYTYGGRLYAGERVSLSSGGDNIGDYQRDIGRNLSNAARDGQAILVYVDPDNPSNAVIDRGVRWGLLGFKSIFLFVFGGVGLGGLILIWRARKEKDKSLPEFQKAPWLLNDAWATPSIRSSSKNSMYGAWAFAGLWNLISAPLPFLLYGEVVDKQNHFALVGLLFPLVGAGLLVWAIRRTLEWTRFGAAPVSLDPFPGSIGGHVGGTIDLNLPFDPSTQFQMTLTNVHSYVSGSGDDRSQREKATWQDAIVAHAEPSGSNGTRLTFRFDVPGDLHESDTDKDDSYYLWRLNLKAVLPGTDLDRDYEIPVYATAKTSRHLSDRAVQKARAKQDAVDDQAIRGIFDLSYGTNGKRLRFPMGRHISTSSGGLVVGAAFAAVGWYLIFEEGQRVFGSVFGGLGALVAVFCLYMMLNSLEVARDHDGIRSVRRLLGIPISRKHMSFNEFARLEKDSSFQSQSGRKHVIHYSIHAIDKLGSKLVVGEGFKSESEANAAMRLISREFGLPSEDIESHEQQELLGADVLSADR